MGRNVHLPLNHGGVYRMVEEAFARQGYEKSLASMPFSLPPLHSEGCHCGLHFLEVLDDHWMLSSAV